jgi:hypothetical protein
MRSHGQTDGAAPRAGTRPKRARLSVLLATAAVVVIATVALLVMWAAPLARSGAGAQGANPSAGAGSAIIHDDAGNVNDYSYPLPPGKAQQLNAGSAVIHDDAGAVHPYTPEEVDPGVHNLRGR